MKTVVVDASVALRWFLPDEERGDKALALLESYVRGEIRMVVPSLLGLEVLNGLLIASRRGRLEIATALLEPPKKFLDSRSPVPVNTEPSFLRGLSSCLLPQPYPTSR